MAETGAAADITPNVVDPAQPGLTNAQRLKAIVGGSAGNLVEWYDWFAYTSFSIYFASSFFPEGDDNAQWLKAAMLNMVSFGARPIGAWAMGLFADRAGRKTALIVAVLMMCVGSLIMAVAPTYAQVGLLAPAILVGARLLQGLSVGGQYGAAATYMSEMATRARRGFWSSFQYVTLIAGQLLAVTVLIVLQQIYPEQAIKDWAWRIAFWFGAGLAIVVFLFQNSLHETQSYKNAKAAGLKASTSDLVLKYPKQTLAIIGLTAAGTSGFYAYTTYMLKFLVAPHGEATVAHFTKPQATNINFLVLAIFMFVQPLFGLLADIFGRKTMLIVAFVLGTVVAYPIFSMMSGTTNFWAAVLLGVIPLICLSGYTSISAVVKAELFPAHVRALGVALPYAISNAVFGALVEPTALGWKKDGVEHYFYIYIAVLMLVGAVSAIFLLKETSKHSMILED